MNNATGVSGRRCVHQAVGYAVLAGLALAASPAVGQIDQIWNGGSGNWNTTELNWDGGSAAWVNDSNDPNTAVFPKENNETIAITLTENIIAEALKYGASSGNLWTLEFNGPGVLELSSGVVRPDPAVNNASTNLIFNTPIAGSNGLTFARSDGTTSNEVQAVTIYLNAANTYTGPTRFEHTGTANPSLLVLRDSDALGGIANVGDANRLIILGHGDVRLENDIRIPQGILLSRHSGLNNPGGIVSVGNNVIEGVVQHNQLFTQRKVEVVSGTLELAGGWDQSNSSGGMGKLGPGTLLITGASPTGRRMTVNEGKVLVNTNWGNTPRNFVHVNNGGTLGGTGTIFTGTNVDHISEIRSGGKLAPGDVGVAGTLTFNGGLRLLSGSILEMDLSNSVGGANDRLVMARTGTGETRWLRIDDGAVLNINALTGALELGTYRLIQLAEAGHLRLGPDNDGNGFTLNMPSGYSGNLIYGDTFVDLVVIPEPGTLALLGLGGLMMLRRRRRPL